MKFKQITIIWIATCFIGLQCFSSSYAYQLNSDNYIIVPDDFNTIQQAINNANHSDTIFIKQGIYRESLIINKSINLIGENKQSTIIDGNDFGFIINIHAIYVNISNLLIQNCNSDYPGIAIFVYNSDTINISNCIIKNNNIGSSFLNSDNITIYQNEYINNKIGIKSERDVYKSKDYQIFSNTFTGNLQHGIYLSQVEESKILNNTVIVNSFSSLYYNFGLTLEESKNCLISNNEITGYITAIRLLLSENIECSKNLINNNDVSGFYLYISSADIHDNIISNNGKLVSGVIPRTEKGGIIIFGRSPNKIPFQTHFLITKNSIISNKGYGLYIERTTSTVRFNDFMSNTKDAFFLESLNSWNENFWNHRRIFPKMISGIQKTPIGSWRQGIKVDLYPSTYPNITEINS